MDVTQAITVLIVEDHQVTLDGLRYGLANEPGISVVGTATDSDSGLKLAQNLRPDVVLLDLHLPGQSGPKTMVQAYCNIPGTKVIIFSGEGRMAFIQTVLSLGVVGYLLKSENVSKIAETIQQVMAGKQPIISQELLAGETKVTKSEQEVLKLLSYGMKYQDIAEQRQTSPATVRKQCELLLLKLGLANREELIAWAVKSGYGDCK